ncbi:MAG: S8 family peptidase, partial [Vicinamibacterales bacterium]
MENNTQIIRARRPIRVIWHISTVLVVGLLWQVPFAASAEAAGRRAKLSSDLAARLTAGSSGDVDVIVSGSVEKIGRIAERHGLRIKKQLSSGAVFSVSTAKLDALSLDDEIDVVSANAIVRSAMALTTAVTGADAALAGQIATLGKVNGSGIGVAVIDSGIADHPALQNRVVANVDFTDPRGRGYDYYGHGTHIAGIIAARAFNNSGEGADSGMAPAAHLINLKVLDSNGAGEAADVIEAIDWAVKYRRQYGIRVINLSLGAVPTLSYTLDPICLAVKRASEAGLVVVASAGNYGQTPEGKLVAGSITSPGISPYAITVGATRTQGTLDTSDDEVAPWSSKGPTADNIIKPDLVAPGSKIVSTAVKGSTLTSMFPDRLLDGPGARDYFPMSGTSMSAAVVSGAVALLLDSQSNLTPFQVKVALQASAHFLPSAGLLVGGAGELDLEHLGSLQSL